MILTEARLAEGFVVYGFLRLTCLTERRHTALMTVIEAYCRQHDLILGGVFSERPCERIRTPAFVGLLDALQMDGTHGVVIPSPPHLGPKRIATLRTEQIKSLGAHLLPVRDMAAQECPA